MSLWHPGDVDPLVYVGIALAIVVVLWRLPVLGLSNSRISRPEKLPLGEKSVAFYVHKLFLRPENVCYISIFTADAPKGMFVGRRAGEYYVQFIFSGFYGKLHASEALIREYFRHEQNEPLEDRADLEGMSRTQGSQMARYLAYPVPADESQIVELVIRLFTQIMDVDEGEQMDFRMIGKQ